MDLLPNLALFHGTSESMSVDPEATPEQIQELLNQYARERDLSQYSEQLLHSATQPSTSNDALWPSLPDGFDAMYVVPNSVDALVQSNVVGVTDYASEVTDRVCTFLSGSGDAPPTDMLQEDPDSIAQWCGRNWGGLFRKGGASVSIPGLVFACRLWLLSARYSSSTGVLIQPRSSAISVGKTASSVVPLESQLDSDLETMLLMQTGLQKRWTVDEWNVQLASIDELAARWWVTSVSTSSIDLTNDQAQRLEYATATVSLSYLQVAFVQRCERVSWTPSPEPMEVLKKYLDFLMEYDQGNNMLIGYQAACYCFHMPTGTLERYLQLHEHETIETSPVTIFNSTQSTSVLQIMHSAINKSIVDVYKDHSFMYHDLFLLRLIGSRFVNECKYERWFDDYVISPYTMAQQWSVLTTPTRGDVMRRPLILVLLGAWHVLDGALKLYTCGSARQACVVWMYLVYFKYKGESEDGCNFSRTIESCIGKVHTTNPL